MVGTGGEVQGAVRVRTIGSRNILSGSDGVCYKERPGLTERSSGRRVWGGSGWVGGGGGTHDSMMGWWVMEVLVIVKSVQYGPSTSQISAIWTFR